MIHNTIALGFVNACDVCSALYESGLKTYNQCVAFVHRSKARQEAAALTSCNATSAAATYVRQNKANERW